MVSATYCSVLGKYDESLQLRTLNSVVREAQHPVCFSRVPRSDIFLGAINFSVSSWVASANKWRARDLSSLGAMCSLETALLTEEKRPVLCAIHNTRLF